MFKNFTGYTGPGSPGLPSRTLSRSARCRTPTHSPRTGLSSLPARTSCSILGPFLLVFLYFKAALMAIAEEVSNESANVERVTGRDLIILEITG